MNDKLSLIGVNSARSAFLNIKFPEFFFENYKVGSNENDPAGGAIRFKVLTKPLVNIFKFRGKSTGHRIEKFLIRLENAVYDGAQAALTTQYNAENAAECRLVVEIIQQGGMSTIHRLFYSDCEVIQSPYNKEACRNMWVASPNTIGSWVTHFQRGLEEVSMMMNSRVVRISSWSDIDAIAMSRGKGHPDRHGVRPGEPGRGIHTEINLDPGEFEVYDLALAEGENSELTQDVSIELIFSLKEFKALLLYADAISAPVEAYFDEDGAPILFCVSTMNEEESKTQNTISIDAQLVLATISNAETQMTGSASRHGTHQSNTGSGQRSAVQRNVSSVPPVPSPLGNIHTPNAEIALNRAFQASNPSVVGNNLAGTNRNQLSRNISQQSVCSGPGGADTSTGRPSQPPSLMSPTSNSRWSEHGLLSAQRSDSLLNSTLSPGPKTIGKRQGHANVMLSPSEEGSRNVGSRGHHQRYPPSYAPEMLSIPQSSGSNQDRGASFQTPVINRASRGYVSNMAPIAPGSVDSSDPASSMNQTPIAPAGRTFRLQEMPRAIAPPGLFDQDVDSNEQTPKGRKSSQKTTQSEDDDALEASVGGSIRRQIKLSFFRNTKETQETVNIDQAISERIKTQGQILISGDSSSNDSSDSDDRFGYGDDDGELDGTPPPSKKVM
ncbi:hypothetical protein H4219_000592 [Mycoemilia scoparia]|uniref:Uncharacterized protein n=1 Tax=Mycoemilia scoparia TaxID=417184 RepID=A0A9W8A3A6_9FUNG|nr:hypothetical protein H4219_000592 [Mycoemilia scoparia]